MQVVYTVVSVTVSGVPDGTEYKLYKEATVKAKCGIQSFNELTFNVVTRDAPRVGDKFVIEFPDWSQNAD